MRHLKDPEFLADAKKSKLNVDPVAVEEVEKEIAEPVQARSVDGRQTERDSLQLKTQD